MAHNHTIHFTRDAWDRMWSYVDAVPGEIGGMGYLTNIDGNLVVDTVFLLPQTRSTTAVDFADPENPLKLDTGVCDDAQMWAIDKGIADGRLTDMKFSWHSHGDIGTMWSSTDEEGIEKYGLTMDWCASAVLNHKRDFRARIDVFGVDFIGQATEHSVNIRPFTDGVMLESVLEEIDSLTIEKKVEVKGQFSSRPTNGSKASPSGPQPTRKTSGGTPSRSGSGHSYSKKSLSNGGKTLTFGPDGMAEFWSPKWNKPFDQAFATWLADEHDIMFITTTDDTVYACDNSDVFATGGVPA